MTAAPPVPDCDTTSISLVDSLYDATATDHWEKTESELIETVNPATVECLVTELLENLGAYSREGAADQLRRILEVARRQSIQAEEPHRAAIAYVKAQTAFRNRKEVGGECRQKPARVLVADDNEHSRDLLVMTLQALEHEVTAAADGVQAWETVQCEDFDLVLLDIEMPGMSGLDVLQAMRENDQLRHVPVIVISGMDEMESVVTCIEMGAEDHLPKPFNYSLLKARIDTSLEKKRLRDAEQKHVARIRREQKINEALLLNVLPRRIAGRLKRGETPIADHFEQATVLFADLVGFTEMSSSMAPSDLVEMLNHIFTEFDRLAERHGLEKIKTIGDSYMAAGGLPEPDPDHPAKVGEFALGMREVIARQAAVGGLRLNIRIGINTGPVVAGVIGRNKFIYDLWGDTVNVASRMESHGEPGAIQVSESTAKLLESKFDLEFRGVINIKGKGEMPTFRLCGLR